MLGVEVFLMGVNRVSRFLHRAKRAGFSVTLHVLLFLVISSWCGETYAAQLRLSWLDTANNENGFEIERKTGADGTFEQVAIQGANLNFYPDNNLAPDTTYCYRVRAFNTFGTSAYSNEACAMTSTIIATLETPEDGQAVSGIDIIRGWSFDTQEEGKISGIDLFLDGTLVSVVPCCSPRSDVQAAFPQFSSANTENSGWGVTINWGLLSVGAHTVQVGVRNIAGETLSTESRTVTVVRPGDFEFLDQFDLSTATASIVNDELVVEGIVVRDKATQQQKEIDTRFRWFSSSQSFGLVGAITKTEGTSAQSFFRWLLASLLTTFQRASTPTAVHADSGFMATFESPEEGQAVSGIGLCRGWAFAGQVNAAISGVRLLLDDTLAGFIPCCSARLDVAAAFPDAPNALNSGWGITLNYGRLSSGLHRLGVQIQSSAGDSLTLSRGVTIVNIGGFEFLNQFDLSTATAQVQDGTLIVIQGANVRDKVSEQTKMVDVVLQWRQDTQALGIVASSE
jgi:hypothetical protein